MPELAEVAYYANQWSSGLSQTVKSVWLNPDSRVFRGADVTVFPRLQGQTFDSIQTHGKRMLFEFSGGLWLFGHLGMTGKLIADDPELYVRAKHDRLVLSLDTVELVFNDARHFGRMDLIQEDRKLPKAWANLPPDVRTDAFSLKRLKAVLDRRPRANVKAILLDQAVCPGIGNWMADEILWRARINPRRTVETLNRAEPSRFYKSIKEVTDDAMRVIAPDWGDCPDEWLFNHRWKDGGICPKTNQPLTREEIAGRTTCWSPSWQR